MISINAFVNTIGDHPHVIFVTLQQLTYSNDITKKNSPFPTLMTRNSYSLFSPLREHVIDANVLIL